MIGIELYDQNIDAFTRLKKLISGPWPSDIKPEFLLKMLELPLNRRNW